MSGKVHHASAIRVAVAHLLITSVRYQAERHGSAEGHLLGVPEGCRGLCAVLVNTHSTEHPREVSGHCHLSPLL